ncbi:MAG: hypothetical protein LRZ87_02630 [Methanocellales archaeon]|nr:hypothetical protein [Methanocellales archaeon]
MITIYAEKQWKLENAIKEAQRRGPVVLERVPKITKMQLIYFAQSIGGAKYAVVLRPAKLESVHDRIREGPV